MQNGNFHNKINGYHNEVPVATRARDTLNLVRNVVEGMKIETSSSKSFIPLSIGDPTTFGNLPVSEATNEALYDVIREGKCHGYGPSDGLPATKEAIAQFYSTSGYQIQSSDVIVTSSCSGSLDIAIGALAEENSNILVPKPGFTLYETQSTVYNVKVKYYNLLPHRNWEIDLQQMESQIDTKTSAIIVNNPSNPCGSVWSLQHMLSILEIAERHNLPLIADEVYAYMVFSHATFYSFGNISQQVPVLVAGGLAKRWLAPGWRIGWLLIFDKHNQLTQVRKGIKNLTQRILGANTLCQSAIPKILANTSPMFYKKVINVIETNARYTFQRLRDTPGLTPIMPSGAMYIMVGIDRKLIPKAKANGSPGDVLFTEQLVKEQNVFCLPGTCFKYPNYMRIVLTVPLEMIKEACDRINEFCRLKLSLVNMN